MIKNIEIYENGNQWVVSWDNDKQSYPENSEAFPSKQQAEEFAKGLDKNYQLN